jgi:alpha-N-arabinofuranosidase
MVPGRSGTRPPTNTAGWREVGKALKLFDPALELVACGSSNDDMPTFRVLGSDGADHCYETVDYISMHRYYNNNADDLDTFLASSVAWTPSSGP